jgi:predicted PhzF superfamily epimerase YddE/YHI9
MMLAEVHQIVTFSTEVFRGNPAFVVSLTTEVSDRTMQALTSQFGELVLTSLRNFNNQVLVRFHTPKGVHGGTGHTMMAAAHLALERYGNNINEVALVLGDKSQRSVFRKGSRITVPWPIMPATVVNMRELLGAGLGSTPKETLETPFGYVAVYDEPSQIQNLQPEMATLLQLDRGAIIATAPGNKSDFVLRVFAPKLGLEEDPVCGTAHRILVPYWSKKAGRSELYSQQLSPRGGELWCWLDSGCVFISGESVTFLKGLIDIPES